MADSEELDVWDREAERAWKGDDHISQFTPAVNALILKHVPKGEVLDAGCNIGKHLDGFRKLGYQPLGVEQSEVACGYAQETNPWAEIFHLRIQQIPDKWENRFVLIHTSAVLQHNIHDRKRVLLNKFRQVLKPGGYYLMTENVGADDGFGNSFTLGGWRIFLKSCGFEYVDGVPENNYWLFKVEK